jgi:hypothetical protein
VREVGPGNIVITVLEEVGYSLSLDREAYWISALRLQGFDLLNNDTGRRRGSSNVGWPLPKKNSLHDIFDRLAKRNPEEARAWAEGYVERVHTYE